MPTSGATRPTASGSTGSAWACGPTWAAAPAGLLVDRGFLGRAWAATQAGRGTQVVVAHSRAERRTLPRAVRRPVAALRNRIETTIGELTDALGLVRHRAKTSWGLLTRTAATILAHTLIRLGWT